MSDTTGASMLGAVTPLPGSPDEAALDCVPHERLEPYGDKVVRLSVPEFTSLCPVTGQPDFAHIVIDYVPDKLLVESKALKLFMGSFRNHPAFHELTTEMIGSRLYLATRPTWICVSAFWYPRGGIPIDVFYQRGTLPYEVYLPPCDVPQYRGR